MRVSVEMIGKWLELADEIFSKSASGPSAQASIQTDRIGI